MTEVKLYVNGAAAKATPHGRLTDGMVGATVSVTFDEAWEGLTPSMIAVAGTTEKKMTVDAAGNGVIPHECMLAGEILLLGVKGINADGDIVIPTIMASCGVVERSANNYEPTEPAPTPTPGEVDQIRQIAYSASTSAEDAKVSAQQAAGSAASASAYAQSAYESAASAAEIATIASQNAATANQNAANAVTIAQGVRDDADDGKFDGSDGFSPTVSVEEIERGHRVSITDKDGTKEFDVMDGQGGGGAVNSVNGKTGDVTLNAVDVGAYSTDEADQKLSSKMERFVMRLVKNADNTYKITSLDDSDMTFNEVYSITRDLSEYVVIIYGSSKLRPQYVSVNEMTFIGLDRSTDTKVLRILYTPTRLTYETFKLAEYADLTPIKEDLSGLENTVAGKYTKPSTGIPATDLAAGVIPPTVTDAHINSLIDTKLTPIDALADDITEVVGA